LLATRAIKSSILERNSLSIGVEDVHQVFVDFTPSELRQGTPDEKGRQAGGGAFTDLQADRQEQILMLTV
jgi:hypothetical protein